MHHTPRTFLRRRGSSATRRSHRRPSHARDRAPRPESRASRSRWDSHSLYGPSSAIREPQAVAQSCAAASYCAPAVGAIGHHPGESHIRLPTTPRCPSVSVGASSLGAGRGHSARPPMPWGLPLRSPFGQCAGTSRGSSSPVPLRPPSSQPAPPLPGKHACRTQHRHRAPSCRQGCSGLRPSQPLRSASLGRCAPLTA